MTDRIRVSVLQLGGAADPGLGSGVLSGYMDRLENVDFIVLGAEVASGQSAVDEPCPSLSQLARATGSHVVARTVPPHDLYRVAGPRDASTVHLLGPDGAALPCGSGRGRFRTAARASGLPKVIEAEGARVALVRCSDFLDLWPLEDLGDADLIFFCNTLHNGLAMDMARKLAASNVSYVVMSCCNGRHCGRDYFCSGAAVLRPASVGVNVVDAETLAHTMPDGCIQASLDLGYIREAKTRWVSAGPPHAPTARA